MGFQSIRLTVRTRNYILIRAGHAAPRQLDAAVAGRRRGRGLDGPLGPAAHEAGGAEGGPAAADICLNDEIVVVAVGEVGGGVGRPGEGLGEGGVGAVGEGLGDGVALGALNGLPGEGDLAVPGRLGAGRRRGRVGRGRGDQIGVGEGGPPAVDACLHQEPIARPVGQAGGREGLASAGGRQRAVAGTGTIGHGVLRGAGHAAPRQLDAAVAGRRRGRGLDGPLGPAAHEAGGAEGGPAAADICLNDEIVVVAVGEVGGGVGRPGEGLGEGGVGAVGEGLGDGVALGALNGLPGEGDLAVPGRLGAGRRRGRVGRGRGDQIGVGEGGPPAVDACLHQEPIARPVGQAGGREGLASAGGRQRAVAGTGTIGHGVLRGAGHAAPRQLDAAVAGRRRGRGLDGPLGPAAHEAGGAEGGPAAADICLNDEIVVVAVGEVGGGVGRPGEGLGEGGVGAVGEGLGDGVALGALNGLPGEGDLAVPGRLGAGRRRGRAGGDDMRI